MKRAVFVGSSLDDLRSFPKSVQQRAGYQVDRVQQGLDPTDWKPMPNVGGGVREIRIRDAGNAYRCLYVANIGDAVYVLHVFQKTTQQTAKGDVELARSRLRDLQRRDRR